MSEDQLRSQLYGAFANRAHIYHLLFTQLQSELGTEKAAELMGRAIYQRGVQQAAKYASFAPRDLAGLGRAFVCQPARRRGHVRARSGALRCRQPGHQIPSLPAQRSLAGCQPGAGGGGHTLPDCGPGRQRHVRGSWLPVPRRHVSARRRRLLLPARPGTQLGSGKKRVEHFRLSAGLARALQVPSTRTRTFAWAVSARCPRTRCGREVGGNTVSPRAEDVI